MSKNCGVYTIFLLIIYNCCFDFCAATNKNDEISFLHYDINTELLPHIGPSATFVKLREKRETPTDEKNQYQSITQNGTATNVNPAVLTVPTQKNIKPEVVVPYTTGDRPLLGVNGTGQLKDVSDKQSSSKYPKKVLSTEEITHNADESSESQEQQILDNIDVPMTDTVTNLKKQNFTVNTTTDYHEYYNSTVFVNENKVKEIWTSLQNISHNQMLSQSHRRAMTVDLTFDFPFYGHPVRKVTVATGGFLYTGEYVHSWLAATQYIAPLMANFDTSLSNDSFVRFKDNGTAFTVVWENVTLQDKKDVGKFSFSATLHESGDIVFAYLKVPISVVAIQDDKHPVKVGLSDAYIIDKVVYFSRRKTIYEYHRVNFANLEIKNSTLIILKALPTCLDYHDCHSCIKHETAFRCAWCPTLNRCSTGTDRRTQDWLQKGCDRNQINDLAICPAIGERGNNANTTSNKSTTTQSTTLPPTNSNPTTTTSSSTNAPTVQNVTNNPNNSNNNNSDINKTNQNDSNHSSETTSDAVVAKPLNAASKSADDSGQNESKSMGLALGFLLPICIVMTILMWIVYAYRNPHTKSGQLLIQYRPSQWSWRRGEARYTAATIHM